jgi:hypothetical protein
MQELSGYKYLEHMTGDRRSQATESKDYVVQEPSRYKYLEHMTGARRSQATESKDYVLQIYHTKHPTVELQNTYVSNPNTRKQMNALLRSMPCAIYK